MNTEAMTESTFISRIKLEITTLAKVIFCIEPIIVNIIALVICTGLLVLLGHKEFLPDMGKYHGLLYGLVEFLAAFQIIRSASKSLVIPLAAILVGVVSIIVQQRYEISLPIDIKTLKELLAVGVLGAAVCVFYMK